MVDRLRPQLRTFRDERGRELFDLPDAPRPDPDTPAPVAFLPKYDNVLLSHADRCRFGPTRPGGWWAPLGPYKGAVLVDGGVAAVWHIEADGTGSGPRWSSSTHPSPAGRQAAMEVEASGRCASCGPTADVDVDVRLLAVGDGQPRRRPRASR